MKIKVAAEAISDRLIVGLFEGEKQKYTPEFFKGKLGQVELVGQKIVVGRGKRG